MKRCIVSILATLLLLVVFSGTGFAEPRDEALELNRQAQEHYQAKEYRAAAQKFDKAYALFPEPQILLGEALAWYREGSCEEATPTAKSYLREKPDAPEIDRNDMGWVLAECRALEARSLIATGDLDDAQVALDEARSFDAGNKADATLDSVEAELTAAREAADKAEKPKDTPVLQVEKPTEPDPKRESGISTRKWIGGASLGLAAVLAGSSLVLYGVNQEEANAYNDGECSECDPDALRTNAILNRGLYIGSAVFAGLGIALLLWPDSETPTSVSVGFSAGSPTFSFTTAF